MSGRPLRALDFLSASSSFRSRLLSLRIVRSDLHSEVVASVGAQAVVSSLALSGGLACVGNDAVSQTQAMALELSKVSKDPSTMLEG